MFGFRDPVKVLSCKVTGVVLVYGLFNDPVKVLSQAVAGVSDGCATGRGSGRLDICRYDC